jgi:hypothetical protein
MNEVDAIRLREFRQLKEEIRGSREYLIAGKVIFFSNIPSHI